MTLSEHVRQSAAVRVPLADDTRAHSTTSPFLPSSEAFPEIHSLPAVILIVILIIIGIPSPTHSFTLGLNPSFSANPPYRSLSFFSFRIHYMDFPECLLLLLSISVFFTF